MEKKQSEGAGNTSKPAQDRAQMHEIARGLWELGLENGFRVIFREYDKGKDEWQDNVHYQWAREISNSRLSKNPTAIAFPENAGQVGLCLQYCKKHEQPFRIRSGGHQHEGMSTVEDGIVIRLSAMNRIEYLDKRHEKAWIPTGKPLKDIYDELQRYQKTIPGGGCWGVNVGGLTLGGGWGTSCRKMGLTCDNFEEAEVVLASGEVVKARADNKYKDLFWALRGGGGGNFGVVTRFLFKLSDIGKEVVSISMQWESPKHIATIVEAYTRHQPHFPREMTTTVSVRVKHRHQKKYYAIGFFAKYYGAREDIKGHLQAFLDDVPKPDADPFDSVKKSSSRGSGKRPKIDKQAQKSLMKVARFGRNHTDLLSAVINHFVDMYTIGQAGEERPDQLDFSTDGKEPYVKKQPPGVTCLAPHPHKISSGFPASPEVYPELGERLQQIIERGNKENYKGVRLYIVLHSMPGKDFGIKPEDSAFYYRNKEFLLQFQSWWSDPCFGPGKEFDKPREAYQKDKQSYIDWVKTSRSTLDDLLEGAFINFVDSQLSLKDFYGGNLERLQQIKKKYDKDNFFQFPLSIPPAE